MDFLWFINKSDLNTCSRVTYVLSHGLLFRAAGCQLMRMKKSRVCWWSLLAFSQQENHTLNNAHGLQRSCFRNKRMLRRICPCGEEWLLRLGLPCLLVSTLATLQPEKVNQLVLCIFTLQFICSCIILKTVLLAQLYSTTYSDINKQTGNISFDVLRMYENQQTQTESFLHMLWVSDASQRIGTDKTWCSGSPCKNYYSTKDANHNDWMI